MFGQIKGGNPSYNLASLFNAEMIERQDMVIFN